MGSAVARPHEPSDGLVSFVVPLFNGGRYIEQTLRSALDQSHADIEIVVVDDGSTDDSVERAKRMSDDRLRVLRRPHAGIAATRNFGLSWVAERSRYVVFLDQDDLIVEDFVQRLMRVLGDRPDAVGAYAIADYIDSTGAPLGDGEFATMMRTRSVPRRGRLRRVTPDVDVELDELFLRNHVYPPSAALLRTDRVKAVGGCDEAFDVADDWDLMLRLLRNGPLVPDDRILVSYRRHGTNASGDLRRNVRETRMVWARTYFSSHNTAHQWRRLHAAWRADQYLKAAGKLDRSREALRERAPLRALLTAADAFAHVLLLAPLPWWRRHRTRALS